MKKSAFVVASLISVMLASCANTDDIKTDFCPDDPNKQLPGACGCGVADVDTNQNGILDCLEGTIKDQCPDDPDKVIPGICGCGKADTDTDEDGVPDCMDLCPTDAQRVEGCDSIDYTSIDLCPDNPDRINPGVCGCDASLQDDEDKDTDGVPNCLDACPENPNKVEAGICGCDRDDGASNVLDHDGDGTPNCLDECPDNPNKVKKGSGCDIEDSDFDGLDDNEDACPYNPFITIKVSEAPADLDCDTDKDSDLHIRVSADLEQLRTGIGSACTSAGFKPECLPNGNITVCSGNYLYENVCAT
ncbi:MAG: hypothetical protein II180_12955, partial [Proteobacteria bacterium]|nr:hypothetical protein [Pseudomonadota bacterium]